jgi:Zn-dependent protease
MLFTDPDLAAAVKRLAVSFVPLALGIILHEVAHGWMAARRGDLTAAMAGRLTLNPLAHVDPVGLLAFVLTSLSGPFVFGWAKPVPISYRHLRNPLRDMMLIAAAGPLSNLLLALLFAALTRLLVFFSPPETGVWYFLYIMLPTGILINCTLAWLNLLPIPPLDGSRILMGLLPYRWIGPYAGLERYGFILLILLLVLGLLGKVLSPFVFATLRIMLALVGLG